MYMNKHIKRASWEHNIETYQGGKKKGMDWFLIGCTSFLVGFGLLALIVIYG